MNIFEQMHETKVFGRRIRVLSGHMAGLIPVDASVLDVGCGSGDIARLIMKSRSDVKISGIDVLVREDTAIPVKGYDGHTFPHEDNSFDVVMFVDVLHHTQNTEELLSEARRVSRKYVILKDHTLEGLFSQSRLKFMDWVGNRRFGVNLTYNYHTKQQWFKAFDDSGLAVETWKTKLGLYPWPVSMVFGASLHCITRLEKKVYQRGEKESR